MSDLIHHEETEQKTTETTRNKPTRNEINKMNEPTGKSGAPQKVALADLFDRSAPTYERVGVEHFADLGRRLVAHAGLADGHSVLGPV